MAPVGEEMQYSQPQLGRTIKNAFNCLGTESPLHPRARQQGQLFTKPLGQWGRGNTQARTSLQRETIKGNCPRVAQTLHTQLCSRRPDSPLVLCMCAGPLQINCFTTKWHGGNLTGQVHITQMSNRNKQ